MDINTYNEIIRVLRTMDKIGMEKMRTKSTRDEGRDFLRVACLCRGLLEKEMPACPVAIADNKNFYCPNCNHRLSRNHYHCIECGQTINWTLL